MSRATAVACAFAVAGAVLVIGSALWGGSGGLGILGFVAWGLVPWGVLALAGRVVPDPWWTGGAGATGLAAEAGIRASVFLFPAGSTAAIALVFSPIAITVLLVVGAVAGAALGFAWRRGGILLRGLVALTAAVCLGLLVLGLARPDLFPTTVWQRRAALERIGAPRVVKGGERFTAVDVHGPGAWFQAAAVSGAAGDDVVVVEGGEVRLLDPADFTERARHTLAADALGGWSWSSRLARFGDRVVVVQTGGGFQATEVRELDGRPVWSYQPDPKLPPAALRPADLDGDGVVELYSAGHDGLARVDTGGRVVWSQREAIDGIAALLPRHAGSPAWIVATSYGRPVRVFDEKGVQLGERALPDGAGVVGAALLPPHGHVLVLSGEGRVQATTLDGRIVLDVPLADFVATQGLSVTFERDGPALLALSATTEEPRVGRGRVVLVDAAGQVVYDEVLAAPATLFTARRADGGETLLLNAGALRALRPGAPRS